MKPSTVVRTKWVAIAALVLSLAACGSSPSGDGLTDMQREDQNASASAGGLFEFARTQINQGTSETGEPRNINGVTPPADETSEPFVLM